MDTSEPFRASDGHLWYFDFDEAAQLHIVTIKTAGGVVVARATMTRDQLWEFGGTLAELYAQSMEITPEKIIGESAS